MFPAKIEERGRLRARIRLCFGRSNSSFSMVLCRNQWRWQIYVQHTIFEKIGFYCYEGFYSALILLFDTINTPFCMESYEQGSFYERKMLERDWNAISKSWESFGRFGGFGGFGEHNPRPSSFSPLVHLREGPTTTPSPPATREKEATSFSFFSPFLSLLCCERKGIQSPLVYMSLAVETVDVAILPNYGDPSLTPPFLAGVVALVAFSSLVA